VTRHRRGWRTVPKWMAGALALVAGLLLADASLAQGMLELEVRKGEMVRLPAPAVAVFVADPDVADVQVRSPTLVYVLGRQAGETTIYAVDEADRTILDRAVRVRHNLPRLTETIRRIAPDAQLRAESVQGAIVLEGTVGSAAEAADIAEIASRFLGENEVLLNRLAVTAPTQVNLRVRIAEVSRATTKELGINWEAVFNPGTFIFGIATGRSALFNFFTAPDGSIVPIPGVTGSGNVLRSTTRADAVFGQYNRGRFNLNAVIDALEEEGLVTILAEPNLTALSGETASFLAGGEFPIPVGQRNNEITIEFKQFGVSLAFTPTVLSEDRISLRVRPEVSELTENGAIRLEAITIPAIAARRAETTVELASGQSFAIAGLLQNNVSNNLQKLPGLGDLPILGALFRSQRFQRNESELVIIVTPYTVRPVSAPALAAPTDGYVAPSDVERIILGRLHHPQERPGRGAFSVEGRRLIGPAGFIMD
jgi:pilus assembly protein CpaC